MPFKLESQKHQRKHAAKLGVFRMLLLVCFGITAMISLILASGVAGTKPISMKVVLQINSNMTTAHIWAQDFARGHHQHGPQEIVGLFERVEEDIRVMFDGGEIEGDIVSPMDCVEERLEMEKIANIVAQMKALTFHYLKAYEEADSFAEFDRDYDDLYLSLVHHSDRLIYSSLLSLKHYHRRFEIAQIILIVMGLGFAMAIFWISRSADKAQVKAWDLVKRIEDRRELAIIGAKLGTWDWNVATGSLAVNDRWAEMIGLDPRDMPPHFETWKKKVHPDDLARVSQDLEDLLAGKTVHLKSEYRMSGEGGRWVWILDLGKILEWDSNGKPLRAAGIHLDVTDIKMIELELRREKDKAQKYLDMARVIFVALDHEGIVQMINREGCQVLGYPEDEIVGKKWMEHFIPQRYRETIQTVANKLLSEGRAGGDYFVNPVLTSSGDEALISWQNTTLRDEKGAITGHLSSGTDITRQHKHEQALQLYQKRLQSLASRLALTEDRLRQEIAAGLHDSIGQNLAALKLSVDIMRLNMGSGDGAEIADQGKGLEDVSETIDEIVRETWSLSFQLCPPGLQESGIVSALEWLISQYNKEHDCVFRMVVKESPLEICRSTRGLLFQMIRELLINTIKHGAASEVDVFLAQEDGFLLATVTDNGRGFDADAMMTADGKAAGFGLFSIRERLAFIDGKLDIVSVVGEGTRVVIHFPLEGNDINNHGETS